MEYQEHHYQSEDELQLYYREYGSRENAVICLPGLTRNCKDFHEIAVHLCSKYRVLCPDLRGRGQSQRDSNWRNYNITMYVPDIKRLMDAAGIKQAIFLGTSLGGLISMTMAYQEPARVRAIILNDVGPEFDPKGVARILEYVGRKTPVTSWEGAANQAHDNYQTAFTGMPDEFWDGFVRRSYHENSEGIPVPDMDPGIGDAMRGQFKLAGFLKLMRTLRILKHIRGVPLDTWDSFRAVSMPCLVIRGEVSDILSEEVIDRMQSVKPDLVRANIPDRGHAPLLDEPESLEVIDSFMESLQ
jgi:pimeloyl-ACP methyl ester carboxylesterase